MAALSHGMRTLRSRRTAAQDHIFIFRIGCFVGGTRLGMVLEFVNLGGSVSSSRGAEPVIFIAGAMREGRRVDDATVMIKSRATLTARNMYWSTSQNAFWTNCPILHLFELLPDVSKVAGPFPSVRDLSEST